MENQNQRKNKRGQKTSEIKRSSTHRICAVDYIRQAGKAISDPKCKELLEKAIKEVKKI